MRKRIGQVIDKNMIKRTFSVLAITMLTFSFVHAETVEEYKKKTQDIQNQINQNNEKISSVEEEAKKYITEIGELDKEIGKYSSNIEELQKKVDDVNSKIKGYENDLQNASQKYNSAEDLYATRLRSMYENGVPNIVDMLVSSNGISDFFAKMNVYSSVIEYDKSLIGNMKSEKEYTDAIKKDIENQKLQVEQLKYDMEKSAQALESAKSNKQTKANELNKSKEKLTAVNSVLNAEAEKLNEQVKKEIAAAEARARAAAAAAAKEAEKNNGNNGGSGSGGGSNVPSGGTFKWPLTTGRITATFPRYPDGTRHDGVDIGVPCGTPVYASMSGLVIKSTYYLSGDYDGGYRDGYGNTVWVSDGTYTMIYGHLRYNKVVSEGAYVQKGQLIGYTASTGNSTGPHLHFEIRKNGIAINPMQFF